MAEVTQADREKAWEPFLAQGTRTTDRGDRMTATHCPFRDQHPYLASCGCGYGRRPGAVKR